MDGETLKRLKDFSVSSGIQNALSGCRAVIVAFSGGADSTLLLSLIGEIAGDTTVAAAHLNHCLRGAEAIRDNDFCREFCRRRGILFYERKADISALAEKRGESTEECGRNERYRFFYDCRKELAKELSCSESEVLVATAHNADDNLETVLFNLTRGAGLRGLRGILPVRDGIYIRPLLCFSSAEVRDICEREGIEYVVDSTNLSDGYTRNRIRHFVVPELEKINPGVAVNSVGMSASVSDDADFLEKEAEREITSFGPSYPANRYRTLHSALRARIIQKLYFKISDGEITRRQTEHIDALIMSGKSGKVHLPCGVTAYYGRTVDLVVEKDKNPVRDFSFELTEGLHDFPEYGFSVGLLRSFGELDKVDTNIYKQLIYKIINNDKIKNSLFVRSRKEGDVIYFGAHHRKLKKLMCDAAIPERLRGSVPIFCDGEGVLWVPGFPLRDGTSSDGAQGDYSILIYSELSEEDNNGREH